MVQVEKSLQLFEYLTSGKEWKDGELCRKIYGDKESAKYYSLRKRLYERLTQFLMDELNDDVTEGDGYIHGLVTLSAAMLRRKSFGVAYDHLNQARRLAELSHNYELLQIIYRNLLAHVDVFGEDVDQLCRQSEENLYNLTVTTQLDNEFARVKSELKKLKKSGAHFDVHETVRKVLNSQRFIRKKYYNNPAFVLRLMELVRSIVMTTKEYHLLKPYLLRSYAQLVKHDAFRGRHEILRYDFQYMIAHIHYRTRDNNNALRMLKELKTSMSIETKNKHPLLAKITALEAGVLFYTGNLHDSIQLIQRFQKNYHPMLLHKEMLNMELNLAVYTFFSKDYKKANRILQQLPTRTPTLEAEMGKEWFFKRELIEVIFHVELGKLDLAEQRLKALRRQYSDFLSLERNQRIGKFMQFIQYYFNHPEHVQSDFFKEEVVQSNIRQDAQTEDVQAILFFCWLRSKMIGRECYEVLLELVRDFASAAGIAVVEEVESNIQI